MQRPSIKPLAAWQNAGNLAPVPDSRNQDSRHLGMVFFTVVLGLCVIGLGTGRWWNRPGQLFWSREAPVRLVSGPESGFRLASSADESNGVSTGSAKIETKKGTVPVQHEKAGPNRKKTELGGFQVDPNTATEDELCALPAIGPVLAKRIMATRSVQPFRRVEDLRRVSGIGPKTLEKLRPHLRFGAPEPEKENTQDGEFDGGKI